MLLSYSPVPLCPIRMAPQIEWGWGYIPLVHLFVSHIQRTGQIEWLKYINMSTKTWSRREVVLLVISSYLPRKTSRILPHQIIRLALLIQPDNVKDTGEIWRENMWQYKYVLHYFFQEIFPYLSVSLGTISIMSFGLKVSALLMSLFARIAFNPKGGLRPMICRI